MSEWEQMRTMIRRKTRARSDTTILTFRRDGIVAGCEIRGVAPASMATVCQRAGQTVIVSKRYSSVLEAASELAANGITDYRVA